MILYGSLVVLILGILFFWFCSYSGVRHFEYHNQDPGLKWFKVLIHFVAMALLSASIYLFLHSEERSPVVPNSTMVEETKK